MTRKLRVSPDLVLPLEAVTQRFAFLGRTGAGKSYNAGVLFEELVEAKQQAVVVDPNDAWHGVRSSSDGKSPGLPVLIMGGEHGDIPLDPSSGSLVADLVTGERLSAIISLASFETDADEVRFMTSFADRLFRKNRHPMHLFLDEADSYCPQSPFGPQENILLARLSRLAKRGRGKGIGLSLLSQRSAALSKRVLSQTEIMVALQTTDPRDRKAIKEWVEGKGTPEEQEMVLSSLSSLKVGEAWVWSPSFLGLLKKVRFRPKRTFDSGATPRVGDRRRAPKTLAQVDLERVRAQMTAAVEKAKQDDPGLLRKRIKELELALATSKAAPSRTQAPAAPGRKERVREVRVQVAALSRESVSSLNRAVEKMDRISKTARAAARVLEVAAGSLRSELAAAVGQISRRRAAAVAPMAPAEAVPPRPAARAPSRKGPSPGNGDAPDLRGGELRLLSSLAQWHPLRRSRAQLATLNDYTASGGTFSQYMGKLLRHGLVSQDRDDLLEITEAGLRIAGAPAPLPSTPDGMRDFWKERLRGGERKMLDALCEVWPQGLTREELAGKTGYEAGGGTYGQYVGTLRRNEIAEERDKVLYASDSLFPDPAPVAARGRRPRG